MSDKTYTLISDTTEEIVDVLDEAEFNQHLASPTMLDALNKSKLALMNRPEGEVDWQRDERRDAYRAVEEAITKAEGTA